MTGAPRLAQIVRRTVALQGVAALLLVGISAVLVVVAQRYDDRADDARRTLVALERLRGDVLSAETSLRGFTLTERPAFLVPYTEAIPAIAETVARMAPRLEPEEQPLLADAERRFGVWRRTFAEPILDALDRGDRARARTETLSGRGKVQTDAIRADLAALSEREVAILDREQDRADRVRIVGVGIVGLLSVLAVAAALALGRRLRDDVVVPMQDLAAATERFGAGEHDARAPVVGVHEVRVTAAAFNGMAEETGRTVDDLRELDELKTRFVSMVSHELRTPLTSIRGFADELADDRDLLTADQQEAVDVIARNAGYLEEIIDDLLLLSRLEAGRVELEPEDVEVDDLLDAQRRASEPVAAARNIALLVASAPDLVVRADRARLRQSLANLVSNALKFSPAGGTVMVGARRTGDEIVLEVRDDGPGIPADELPRLTERFFRASTSSGTSGTGLGLTITRELVEKHGGRLEIESVPGEGATFRIVLPAPASVQAGDEAFGGL